MNDYILFDDFEYWGNWWLPGRQFLRLPTVSACCVLGGVRGGVNLASEGTSPPGVSCCREVTSAGPARWRKFARRLLRLSLWSLASNLPSDSIRVDYDSVNQ
jgi:hypothetical protein